MKKISNIIFSLFSFPVLAFVSCNLKKGNESISEKIEITETISVSDNIREVNNNIEKPKPRPRIRELDWYVGNWKEVVNEEYSWFDENPKIPIELEISRNNDKYYIVLNENGKKTEGELYIDKIFLPKNLPEEERINYDSRDYLVADFSTFRYWIGIQYSGEDDKISLNIDDIDICVCKRIPR